jgi:uncharacterized protein YabE (DUF348 family)
MTTIGQPAALALALWLVWAWTATPIAVTVDGVAETVRTHRRTVGPLLADLDIQLGPADRVSVPLDSRISTLNEITIQRARPVRLLADGRTMTAYTWANTVRGLLADAEISADNYDQILLNGVRVKLDDPLPARVQTLAQPTYDWGHRWDGLRIEPLQVRIYRAIPIYVDDGNLPFTIRTTAQTVGEALRQAELTLYLGDTVQPSLGSPVSTGLRVFIQRSVPISLKVDGRLIKTRSQGKTVGDALTEMGIGVAGLDQVTPPLETKLYDNVEIKITRVVEDVEVEEDIVPYETVFVPDPNLLIDTQQVVNPGAEGITRRRYRVRYEDGQETERVLEDKWVAQEPAQRVIAYGQKIIPRTYVTADGQEITYWRHIRMKASSYSAGTAGVSPDAPWYGRTRTGDRMRYGVVAIDPRIIPLRTKVYVSGYGFGDALDTGSAIRARRIDLGYDDSNLVLWNRWVDVYLLWPPPPSYQITWVLPNWPPVPN